MMHHIDMTNVTEKAVEANRVNTPIVRACCDCQVEHQVRPKPGESHGYCFRHYVKRYAEMGFSRQEAETKAKLLGPNAFCPDLGELQPA